MKTKFFTIAAAILIALMFTATESKAQASGAPGIVQGEFRGVKIKVNPNPVVGAYVAGVQLPATLSGPALVKITNTSGQIIEQKILNTGGKHMLDYDASAYPAGVYFAILTYEGKNITDKFLKQ